MLWTLLLKMSLRQWWWWCLLLLLFLLFNFCHCLQIIFNYFHFKFLLKLVQFRWEKVCDIWNRHGEKWKGEKFTPIVYDEQDDCWAIGVNRNRKLSEKVELQALCAGMSNNTVRQQLTKKPTWKRAKSARRVKSGKAYTYTLYVYNTIWRTCIHEMYFFQLFHVSVERTFKRKLFAASQQKTIFEF